MESNVPSSLCPTLVLNLQDFITPSIEAHENDVLTLIPDAMEIRGAVASMHENKSPGPDDMSPIFYKKFWSIIGFDVIGDVHKFFEGGLMCRAANHTFLALIPKRAAANRVEQFRPIALCNVIYNIITKIIAERIKGFLDKIIHPSQSAFVPKRSILDNIIINHKMMSYLNSKKGKNGFMAVKVDMTKAYDMVE